MSRIDTATLRQATEEVRAFGVVVSEQDADRIERTNDAISRLGLVWRGLSNQLAVAAAPALKSVADAMVALASRTGPLGMAISGLFDQIGRLSTYAASFAGFMAGRWIAGLAAAALSVRGLATALAVLRGALIRTDIGALIVGAGELVYQFTKLVKGAGGFGNAMALIGADIGQALVGAFQSAENAVGEFVKTGKLDFRDLVTSLLADLSKIAARRFLLGPIANALSGALGGAGGISTSIMHTGGMVGAGSPSRMVPALTFAGAPRLHGGGMVGLRHNEVRRSCSGANACCRATRSKITARASR